MGSGVGMPRKAELRGDLAMQRPEAVDTPDSRHPRACFSASSPYPFVFLGYEAGITHSICRPARGPHQHLSVCKD
jgi:hypothetical protein